MLSWGGGGGGGDLNTDFSRINGQSNCVQGFCERVNMMLFKNFLSHEFSFTCFCDNSNLFIDNSIYLLIILLLAMILPI